jgi:transposase
VYVADRSAIAAEALKRIGQLYAIERQIRGQQPGLRVEARGMQSAPILLELRRWLGECHRWRARSSTP